MVLQDMNEIREELKNKEILKEAEAKKRGTVSLCSQRPYHCLIITYRENRGRASSRKDKGAY